MKKQMEKAGKMFTGRARIAAAFLLLLAAGAAVLLSGRRGAVRAELAEAVRGPVEDWYRENGVLSAGDLYTELSQVGGEVLEVPAGVNRSVKKGDLIVRIDATDYEYQKTLAEAALSGLRAQLELERMSQVMTTSPDEYLSGVERQYESAKAAFEAASSAFEADRTLYEAGDISRVQYENDRAAYEAALSAYEAAKKRFEESTGRYRSLAEEGAEGDELNERFYRSEEDALRAQIASQEASAKNLDEKIGKCMVRARQDGVIRSLAAQNVSMVQPGMELFTLSSRAAGSMCAEADVLTGAAVYLKPGTRVRAVLERRGARDTWEGRVTEVYGFAEKGTSALGLEEYRVHVKAQLPDAADAEHLDGYGVELSFCLYEAEDALTIPVSAAFKRDEKWYVYVPENGRAAEREIRVSYSTGTRLVVEEGLEEGGKVVRNAGAEGLYAGVKLR